jgi:hypothetical protein
MGGSGAVLAAVAADEPCRTVWLFDSWAGLPEPGSGDVSVDGRRGRKGMASTAQETAEALLFDRLRYDRNCVRLVAGWFHDTIEPRLAELRPVSLLHLDNDWYDSTKYCLDTLYDTVSSRGVIVIDDYEYWQGCKRAVDEFLMRRQLDVGPAPRRRPDLVRKTVGRSRAHGSPGDRADAAPSGVVWCSPFGAAQSASASAPISASATSRTITCSGSGLASSRCLPNQPETSIALSTMVLLLAPST